MMIESFCTECFDNPRSALTGSRKQEERGSCIKARRAGSFPGSLCPGLIEMLYPQALAAIRFQ